MYVCMYVCVYVCMYVCMYVCVRQVPLCQPCAGCSRHAYTHTNITCAHWGSQQCCGRELPWTSHHARTHARTHTHTHSKQVLCGYLSSQLCSELLWGAPVDFVRKNVQVNYNTRAALYAHKLDAAWVRSVCVCVYIYIYIYMNMYVYCIIQIHTYKFYAEMVHDAVVRSVCMYIYVNIHTLYYTYI
jgi:hypothetical protein